MAGARSFLTGLLAGAIFCVFLGVVFALFNPPSGPIAGEGRLDEDRPEVVAAPAVAEQPSGAVGGSEDTELVEETRVTPLNDAPRIEVVDETGDEDAPVVDTDGADGDAEPEVAAEDANGDASDATGSEPTATVAGGDPVEAEVEADVASPDAGGDAEKSTSGGSDTDTPPSIAGGDAPSLSNPDVTEEAPSVEVARATSDVTGQDAPELNTVEAVEEAPLTEAAQTPQAPQPATQVDDAPENNLTPLKGGELDSTTPRVTTPVQDTAPQTRIATTEIATPQAPESPEQPVAHAEVNPEPAVAPAPSDSGDIAAAEKPGDIEADDQQQAVTAEAEDAPLPPEPVLDGPAFEAYAANFGGSLDKPFLAIVLQHVGEDGMNIDSLTELAVPITFAIDPGEEDARRNENAFRKAGFEVVAIVPDRGEMSIGQRTQLDRVEGILNGYFEAVPGAVAVIDRPLGDFYRNIRVVNVVTQTLNRAGRGMLIHERFGINAAIGSAAAKRVPVAAVKRVIDTNREADAIRAALDRASLEASKTGAAVVFGRTYPETISTLVTWLLSSSARSVTIAPLTTTISN